MIVVKVHVEATFSSIDYYSCNFIEVVVGEDKEKCIEYAYTQIQEKVYVFMVVSDEALIETYSAELIDGVYQATKLLNTETRKIDFC